MTDKDFQKRRVENITIAVEQLAAIIQNAGKKGASDIDINQSIVDTIALTHDEGMSLAMDKIKSNEGY